MSIKSAVTDVVQGFQEREFWVTFGMNDIKAQYRRSKLGQLWYTLSVAIFIFVIGALFRNVFHNPNNDYLLYMATGYIFWLLLQGIVNSGSMALISAVPFLTQRDWPKSTFSYRILYREFFIFLHNVIIILGIFIWKKHWPGFENLLWFVLGFSLTLFAGFWIALFVSILNLRYRDMQPIIQSIMRMVFFATPVIWVSRNMGGFGEIIYLINPFRYFLDIVREPLLGNEVPIQEFIVASGLSIVAMLFAVVTLAFTKNKITFWL